MVQVRCIYFTDGAYQMYFILQLLQLSYWSISESASVEGRWSDVIPNAHLEIIALKFLTQDNFFEKELKYLTQDKNVWKGIEISDPG